MIRSNRIALGFLALAACSTDDSTVPTMPPDVAALAVRSPDPWAYRATGGGQDLYPGSTTSDFQIAFQAKEDASGNDVGSVLWTDPTTGTIIQKGLVDCLYVQDNRAWIRYVVNIGADRFHTYIGFEDNGEGLQAAVDRHTYIYGGPFDPTNFTCEFFANTNGFGTGFPVEWIRGNVQVK